MDVVLALLALPRYLLSFLSLVACVVFIALWSSLVANRLAVERGLLCESLPRLPPLIAFGPISLLISGTRPRGHSASPSTPRAQFASTAFPAPPPSASAALPDEALQCFAALCSALQCRRQGRPPPTVFCLRRGQYEWGGARASKFPPKAWRAWPARRSGRTASLGEVIYSG